MKKGDFTTPSMLWTTCKRSKELSMCVAKLEHARQQLLHVPLSLKQQSSVLPPYPQLSGIS